MRIPLLALATLLACSAQTRASAGVSCHADDASVKFIVEAAFGRSIGSGVGNFGGEVETRLKGLPDDARKLSLETKHLSQNWFHDRDIKLAIRWLRDGDEPSPEIVLIIETRRGKQEGAPYRGRYALKVFTPQSDGRPREASGRVECSVSD